MNTLYPTKAELVEIQDQLDALHRKMHDFANAYPRNSDEFITIAVKLTDSLWKLDDMVKTAEHVEAMNAKIG